VIRHDDGLISWRMKGQVGLNLAYPRRPRTKICMNIGNVIFGLIFLKKQSKEQDILFSTIIITLNYHIFMRSSHFEK